MRLVWAVLLAASPAGANQWIDPNTLHHDAEVELERLKQLLDKMEAERCPDAGIDCPKHPPTDDSGRPIPPELR